MGEWGFRDYLERNELHQYTATSAGVVAVPGSFPTGETVLVLGERDIDATRHRARLLDRDMVEAADLVLCMTRAHVDAVVDMVPAAKDKTFLLTEICPDRSPDEIDDPFGGTLDYYRQCLRAIESCFECVVSKLQGETGR
jgi:protein-tyrosine-phosphatase